MKKENFQVDGVGINAAHYEGFKESDFIKELLPSIPDRFGDDASKKSWAKGAFDLMNKTFPQLVEKPAK